MAQNMKIKCAECVYARQDANSSAYSRKTCGKCELWADCGVCLGCEKRGACKARDNQNSKQTCDRRCETVCKKQELKWAAMECGCSAGEFYRALLNVTRGGDMLDEITWSGCNEGVLK
jgi:hypothetical protein